jgi:6-phosphogluconolactonase
MKLNTLGRNLMIAALSAALGLGATACSRDYVAAYVYATSSATGGVSAFAVDYQSGILNQVTGSPFASNLKNPISSIASPDGKHLYEIGGDQDNAIQVWSIGSDGKIYGSATPNISGAAPTGAAMDPSGKFLYVTYRYQIGFGPNNDGPGGITVFTLGSDGNVTATANVPLGEYPLAITLTPPITTYNGAIFAYVAEQTTSTTGLVVELQQNLTTGLLTPTSNTISAGVNPSSIIAEPTGRFIYVSDKSTNQILGYHIVDNTGKLQTQVASPYPTGLLPVQMTIDPRGKYLYTVNFNSSTISGYNINPGDGSLNNIVGVTNFQTNTNPTCVTVDPSVGIYLYTSNLTDGSISGAQIKPEDGSLTAVANTPFPTSSLPSCVTSVANGSHALSIVYPN